MCSCCSWDKFRHAGLPLLRRGQSAHVAAAPLMRADPSRPYCSLVRCRLCVAAVPQTSVGLSGLCSFHVGSLLVWLLLFGLEQAAQAASAPRMGVGCSLHCCSSYSARLLTQLLLCGQWMGCLCGCCSMGGRELHLRLLLGLLWAPHPATACRTGAGFVWLLLLGPVRAMQACCFLDVDGLLRWLLLLE